MNPFLATDGYKTGHHKMYPQGTTLVYSNFTPRHGKHSNTNLGGVISFGQQMVMKQIKEMFNENFFKVRTRALYKTGNLKTSVNGKVVTIEQQLQNLKDGVCGEIKKEYSTYLGTDYDVSHIEALWDLGYLPIKVKALPEGTFVPYGVPVLTIVNTKPEFFWLTNFLETLISNLLWKPMTSATIAYNYKKILKSWVDKTDKEAAAFVDFQGHDFSMRGMDSVDATIASGLGHATSFLGSDSLPVIHGGRKYYEESDMVIVGVPATEHSVMCAGTKGDEIGTFKRLMELYPKGILSVVSDTWDLWKVLTEYLPELKEEILTRDGKLVIRPDSGDPVEIICGFNHWDWCESYEEDSKKIGFNCNSKPEYKGVIELLWDIFGGTINEQGYKVLDPHIGAIYGDSITLERANEICKRLEAKGFASTNIVLGIGSYTYQYNTRDTFGFAMKATYVEVEELTLVSESETEYESKVVGREIFKDPITDDGTKKSAKGLLRVDRVKQVAAGSEAYYKLRDQQSWDQESNGALQLIFEDGKFFNETTLTEIRERLKIKN